MKEQSIPAEDVLSFDWNCCPPRSVPLLSSGGVGVRSGSRLTRLCSRNGNRENHVISLLPRKISKSERTSSHHPHGLTKAGLYHTRTSGCDCCSCCVSCLDTFRSLRLCSTPLHQTKAKGRFESIYANITYLRQTHTLTPSPSLSLLRSLVSCPCSLVEPGDAGDNHPAPRRRWHEEAREGGG